VRPWTRLVLLLLVLLASSTAAAHELRPAVLAVHERDDGSLAVAFHPALDASKQPLEAVAPIYAPECESSDGVLRCPEGSAGTVQISGLDANPVDVVVRVTRRDGTSRTVVLRGRDDAIDLLGPSGMAATTGPLDGFLLLGVEHIVFGFDHVLFVLTLALLVGFTRRLLLTITGFTIAHSITLAAATLGVVTLPSAPVEAAIAISIVLVAVEVAHDRPSLTRRWPGLVAFGFGLLHGFGFAGALAEVGLPPDRTGLALLGFNLGVELGQIAILGIAWAITRPLRPHLGRRAHVLAAYGAGVIATAWTIDRIAALIQPVASLR
jgi:hydrogenase/urease accessory protein HupE